MSDKMRVVVTIECEGDAFAEMADAMDEVERLLRHAADRVSAAGFADTRLFDVNGNECGSLVVTD